MKILFKITIVIFMFCMVTINSNAQGTYSGQAVNESLASGSHASESMVYSVAAGSQIVSAVAAIPLMAVGASGAVVGEIGEDLWHSATSGEQFEISDEIVTAGPPPNEALDL